ncbi:MAG: fluoride efflux transporter CrcB [Candidatus Rokubacteria bacterium]|nr:fluoride efflux transporter CrcB [Candidatus Rokubacteria bacterium]
MAHLLLVCLGGAVGSGLRYLTALLAVRLYGDGFPYGTLAVNLVGCFLIGFVNRIAAASVISEDMRLLLSTGVLGGLTTYSAFSYESVRMVQLGDWRGAVLNIGVTTVISLVLCVAGMLAGARLER